ncbi:MAG: hypothetical protein Q8P48_01690, partial [Deltaproteobacteria bacterium]|nr:hypothetical protein [Deltaproteobacteria bacterium]
LSAEDRFTSVMSRANRSLQTVERRFKSAAESMVNLRTVSIAAGAALAGVSYGLYKAIEAANEADAAEKKLAAALGYTSKALLDQAVALQKVSIFGDDQVVSAQALIASFVRDEAQIKAATRATLDLAAAKGINLTAAADLVSKTLGSTTNALSRYGIQVEGAVGSTERLESLTKNIANVFGGQAAAQAETFGGKLTQVKNALGDVFEEIGFVITRNNFFTKSLDVARQYLERTAQWLQNNRLAMMELAKGGVIRVIEALGWATEAVRFFHNGWLGLKLVGQAVSLALVDSINWIYKALRFLLLPLDLMYQGMVKLGLVEVNPFDAAQKAVNEYREVVLSTGADVLSEIEKTNAGYDRVRGAIKGIVSEMRSWKVEQVELADRTPRPGLVPEVDSKARKELDKARETAAGKLGGLGAVPEVLGPGAPEQFSEAAQMEQRLQAIQDFHVRKLQLMEDAGRTEGEITAAFNKAKIDMDQQTHQLRLSQAQGAFGMMSNMMQNLTVVSGKEGGAAFKAMKAFAIAETTIQTYRAAQGAY